MAIRREMGTEAMPERPGGEAAGAAKEAMGEAKERARGFTERMRGQARHAVERGKNRAAGGMERIGERMERRGESMETRGGARGTAGRVVHGAGDALEKGADYLKTHEIGTIRDDLSGQIREHPFVSVGVALGTGFLVGRAFGGEDEEAERIERLERELRRRPAPREEERGLRNQLGRAIGGGLSLLLARQVRARAAGR